jgi:hypothetical protein
MNSGLLECREVSGNGKHVSVLLLFTNLGDAGVNSLDKESASIPLDFHFST